MVPLKQVPCILLWDVMTHCTHGTRAFALVYLAAIERIERDPQIDE